MLHSGAIRSGGAPGRRIAAAEAIERKRITTSVDVKLCVCLVLRQLGPRKPETVEAYYHIFERVPVPRFSQIRVCHQNKSAPIEKFNAHDTLGLDRLS